MIAGGVVLGLGIAALGTSIAVTKCEGPSDCKYGAQRNFLVPLSLAGAVTGLMLLSVGAGFYARYRKWERWTPGKQALLVPTMIPGGVGLGYAARF